MSDPQVRSLGEIEDIDGQALVVGVDYETVVLREPGQMGKAWRLDSDQAEAFAALFVRACWEASAQAGAA